MNIDDIVRACVAILSVAAVVTLAAKGLLGMFRFAQKLTELIKAVETLNANFAKHLEWHAEPGGNPAAPARPRSNAAPPPRRTR